MRRKVMIRQGIKDLRPADAMHASRKWLARNK